MSDLTERVQENLRKRAKAKEDREKAREAEEKAMREEEQAERELKALRVGLAGQIEDTRRALYGLYAMSAKLDPSSDGTLAIAPDCGDPRQIMAVKDAEITRLRGEVAILRAELEDWKAKSVIKHEQAAMIPGIATVGAISNQSTEATAKFIDVAARLSAADDENSVLKARCASQADEIVALKLQLDSEHVIQKPAECDRPQPVTATKEVPISMDRRPKFNSVIPNLRQDNLRQLPQVHVAGDCNLSVRWSRVDLSHLLGGGSVSLIVTVAKTTEISRDFGITRYICPAIDHNPWCPQEPGAHGFMFVGLGEEKGRFDKAEKLHLFVRLGEACCQYMGYYEAVTAPVLTVDEWHTLPEQMKKKYSEATARKDEHDEQQSTAVLAAYDSGDRNAPCVQLQCLGFDYDLYRRLCASNPGNSRRASSSPSKRDRLEAEPTSAKKRRMSTR